MDVCVAKHAKIIPNYYEMFVGGINGSMVYSLSPMLSDE